MRRERENPPPHQKHTKNNVHQVKLIEKLQKAIMIVRMCRPPSEQPANIINPVAGSVYTGLTSVCPPGPGWVLCALLMYIWNTYINSVRGSRLQTPNLRGAEDGLVLMGTGSGPESASLPQCHSDHPVVMHQLDGCVQLTSRLLLRI